VRLPITEEDSGDDEAAPPTAKPARVEPPTPSQQRVRLPITEEDSDDDEAAPPSSPPAAKPARVEPPTPSQQRVRLPITEEDSDDDEAAPRPPLLPPSKTATEEKDLGNELFRRGDTAGALAAYSRSLVLEPGSAAVYSNRAAVHLKVRSAPIPSVRMEAGK
jgi:hypothetical protein